MSARILQSINLFLDHAVTNMVSLEAWVPFEGSPCGI